MKSLLLKDLYNMRTNVRYLLVMMLVFAVAFIPNGYLNFLFITSTMFSVMMVSTFSYDEYAKWNRYALVMPIQKRDIVAGKFLMAVLFSLFGVFLGGICSVIGGLVMGELTLGSGDAWREILFSIDLSFCIAVLFGTTMIPLLFQFGVEKARMITVGVVAVPVLLLYAFLKFSDGAAFLNGEKNLVTLMILFPVFVLIWGSVMYKISCRIFFQKEF